MQQGDRWIVFYNNGDIFTSNDGDPWDAPRTSVAAIASCKDEKDSDYYLIQQVDRYYYEADRGGWNDCPDSSTLWLHLLRARSPCLLFGEMLSDSNWRELIQKITTYCNANRDWLVGVSDEQPPPTLS